MENMFGPLDTSVKVTNRILLDFEVIADLDLATVYFFIKNCKDPSILNPNLSLANSISAIRNVLLFRSDANPLQVCIKEEYRDSINGLYKDLMNKYEKEILDLTLPNDLFGYFTLLLTTDNLTNITINCKTQLQVDFISKLITNANIALNVRDLEEFDTLYLKYSTDIIEYKNIVKKKIYIINAMYNFNTGVFKDCILLLVDQNIVNTIDPYKNLTVPAIYNMI